MNLMHVLPTYKLGIARNHPLVWDVIAHVIVQAL